MTDYKEDEMYNLPYTKEEQRKMTLDCFLEIMDTVFPIMTKHFEGKLVSPDMLIKILLPLITTIMKHQFDPLPQHIRNKVYTEFYDSFTSKFAIMLENEISLMNEKEKLK
jgi:hypothetical protein